MTSAARPTFNAALGGYSLRDTRAGLQTIQSAKDLNAHLTLKLRQSGMKMDRETLLMRLSAGEAKTVSAASTYPSAGELRVSEVDRDDELSEEDKSGGDDDAESEDDDEDDDEDELMRELAKIKEERMNSALKLENERIEFEKARVMGEALTGNPLLANAQQTHGAGDVDGFVVKRRWDEDVVFKNQVSFSPLVLIM